jgi:hypothetical protein
MTARFSGGPLWTDVAPRPPPRPSVGEVAVVHWRAAGLLKASVIKPLITTIEAAGAELTPSPSWRRGSRT